MPGLSDFLNRAFSDPYGDQVPDDVRRKQRGLAWLAAAAQASQAPSGLAALAGGLGAGQQVYDRGLSGFMQTQVEEQERQAQAQADAQFQQYRKMQMDNMQRQAEEQKAAQVAEQQAMKARAEAAERFGIDPALAADPARFNQAILERERERMETEKQVQEMEAMRAFGQQYGIPEELTAVPDLYRSVLEGAVSQKFKPAGKPTAPTTRTDKAGNVYQWSPQSGDWMPIFPAGEKSGPSVEERAWKLTEGAASKDSMVDIEETFSSNYGALQNIEGIRSGEDFIPVDTSFLRDDLSRDPGSRRVQPVVRPKRMVRGVSGGIKKDSPVAGKQVGGVQLPSRKEAVPTDAGQLSVTTTERAEESFPADLLNDTRLTLQQEGEVETRNLLRQLGHTPSEINRLLAAARGSR
jgi:hypothetical protein